MASGFSREYLDLLQLGKDPSKAFNIEIAEVLQCFLDECKIAENSKDFTYSAMVIQAGVAAYGKKVDNLLDDCKSILDQILEVSKEDNDEQDKGKGKEKERAPKKDRISDPMSSSMDITPGKNISALSRKNAKKTPAATESFVPAHLLPLEEEERGEVFYNTKGEPIGRCGDYQLNVAHLTDDGWILLSHFSPDLIAENDHQPETNDLASSDSPGDEGYPGSCPSSAPGSQVAFSSQGTDEGLGGSLQSSPCEEIYPVEGTFLGEPMEGVRVLGTSLGGLLEAENDGPSSSVDSDIENIPVNDLPCGAKRTEKDPAVMPIPRPMRQALKEFNFEEDDLENDGEEFEDVIAPIGKENTCILPASLRNKKNSPMPPASVYCYDTFFGIDKKLQNSELYSFQISDFANNSTMVNCVKNLYFGNKDAKSKNQDSSSSNSDEEENDEEEHLRGSDDDDDDPANTGLDNNDFEIDESPDHSFAANPGLEYDDFEVHFASGYASKRGRYEEAEEIPTGDVPSMDTGDDISYLQAEFKRIQAQQMNQFNKTIQASTSRVNENFREWQEKLHTFLDENSKRETYDINHYGSRILGSFDENNGRQTMSFREICSGMEKWEVHRYFMALLPLANNLNVELSHEPREDDEEEEDIMITLLSRKMHHLEVKEFGHNAGEHS